MSLPMPPKRGGLPLPPRYTPAPQCAKWTAHKVSYDRAFLHCSGDLTRLEVFRLIGELERIGASL